MSKNLDKFFGNITDDKQLNHSLFPEKYRPTRLDEFIGNDAIKSAVAKHIETGNIPHLMFYGSAGTGKSTLARILAKSLDCDYLIINASDETGVDVVRTKVKGFATTRSFRDGKIIILDEFDYMSISAQAMLRHLMEKFSNNCRFILTCNFIERVIEPIKSRCQIFNVVPPNKKSVAKHISKILKKEGIEYETSDLVTIVNRHYPDMRQIINECQRQIDDDTLVLDKKSQLDGDFRLKILGLLGESRSAKSIFNDIRQLIANNHVSKFDDVYRLLFDKLHEFAKGKETACILIIADYLYKDALVIDSEINFMACIIELLSELKK